MNQQTQYKLPIQFFRVGGTCFSDQQIKDMVARTNSKLTKNNVGITIEEVGSTIHINKKEMAYVGAHHPEDLTNPKTLELRALLVNGQQTCANKTLRVFLIKAELDQNYGAWTYDPINDDDLEGAIFITELFNDNSDEAYEAQGYLASNDSLLHELGHVLMQEAKHFQGNSKNFFHEMAEATDDSITTAQVKAMRGENTNRTSDAPNYLRPTP